jgi:hypothetical protein
VRTVSLHLLADLLVCLSAAPVPPDAPLTADSFVGEWAYKWNGSPGVMHLSENGSYLALHGECRAEYAGRWWFRNGQLIVTEYRQINGLQFGNPTRYEFDTRRERAAVECRTPVTTLILTRR